LLFVGNSLAASKDFDLLGELVSDLLGLFSIDINHKFEALHTTELWFLLCGGVFSPNTKNSTVNATQVLPRQGRSDIPDGAPPTVTRVDPIFPMVVPWNLVKSSRGAGVMFLMVVLWSLEIRLVSKRDRV
jgi:hypothetical protein